MNPKYKTAIYFFMVFLGGGLLLFRDDIKGETQIVVTVIAVCVMMFGLYKVTSSQMSNQQKNYKDQEYYNREKYSQEEELEEE
ncbi:MAG: hypothetical protein AB8B65_09785 [Kordia sp.]|uniref:hypothetical protein n=1 Tax=Kordia sp. TaxID=1965332 RepID=UPI00385C80D2